MTALLACPICHQTPVHVHRYNIVNDYTEVGYRCPPVCPDPTWMTHYVPNTETPAQATAAYVAAREATEQTWNTMMQGEE